MFGTDVEMNTVELHLIRFNQNGEPSGYAENPDNWIFYLKVSYIGGLKFGGYYLQYVPANKPFDHA